MDYNWILNLLSQNKISQATARACIIACSKNVPFLLNNLDRVEKEQTKHDVAKNVRNTLQIQQAKICTPNPYGSRRPLGADVRQRRLSLQVLGSGRPITDGEDNVLQEPLALPGELTGVGLRQLRKS